MKFKRFLESCKAINEAEYNKEWWDSKSDSFKKRYIEKHPNSIYAQKSRMTPNQKKEISKFVDKAFGKNSKSAKTTRDNLSDNSTKPMSKSEVKNLADKLHYHDKATHKIYSSGQPDEGFNQRAKDVLKKAIASGSYNTLKDIANLNVSDYEYQNELYKKLKPKDHYWLAKNIFLDKRIQDKMLNDPELLAKPVADSLVRNPSVAKLNPKKFALLAKVKPSAAAQNDGASSEQLQTIFNQSGNRPEVREFLATNDNTPIEVLEKIIQMTKPDGYYRGTIEDAKRNIKRQKK